MIITRHGQYYSHAEYHCTELRHMVVMNSLNSATRQRQGDLTWAELY